MKRVLAFSQAIMFIAAIAFLVAAMNWKNASGDFLKVGESDTDFLLETLKMTDRSLGYCLFAVVCLAVALLLSWIGTKQRS